MTSCRFFSFGFNFRSNSFGMTDSRGGKSASVSKSGSSSTWKWTDTDLFVLDTGGVGWEKLGRSDRVGSLRPSLELLTALSPLNAMTKNKKCNHNLLIKTQDTNDSQNSTIQNTIQFPTVQYREDRLSAYSKLHYKSALCVCVCVFIYHLFTPPFCAVTQIVLLDSCVFHVLHKQLPYVSLVL